MSPVLPSLLAATFGVDHHRLLNGRRTGRIAASGWTRAPSGLHTRWRDERMAWGLTVVVNTLADFTLRNYRRTAYEGEAVRIGDEARRTMEAFRSALLPAPQPTRPPSPARLEDVPSEVAGVRPATRNPVPGETGPPDDGAGSPGGGYLDEAVVRGIVFARLTNLVSGQALIRPAVVERVAALLEGPLPKVPVDGQVGSARRFPLSQVLGELGDTGLDGAEESALLGGSPCSAAFAADAALRARQRLEHAEAIFALSIEAFRAPLGAYDTALDELFGDIYETGALQSLRSLLTGVGSGGRRFHQAPVSYRIIPRVLGQVRRCVAGVEEAAAVSLRSVTVEEIWFPPDHLHPVPRAVSSPAAYNAMTYPALNALSAAWADLALVAERQVTALNTAETSELPLNLAVAGAPRGTYGYGWAASGFVEEARVAATPALLPALVSGPGEDILTPAFAAHSRERRAAECLDGALTILALVSSQALFATDREAPAGLRSLLSFIRAYFPPIATSSGRDLSAEAGRLQLGAGARCGDGRLV